MKTIGLVAIMGLMLCGCGPDAKTVARLEKLEAEASAREKAWTEHLESERRNHETDMALLRATMLISSNGVDLARSHELMIGTMNFELNSLSESVSNLTARRVGYAAPRK